MYNLQANLYTHFFSLSFTSHSKPNGLFKPFDLLEFLSDAAIRFRVHAQHRFHATLVILTDLDLLQPFVLPGAEGKVRRDKSEPDKRCNEPGRWLGCRGGEAVEST